MSPNTLKVDGSSTPKGFAKLRAVLRPKEPCRTSEGAAIQGSQEKAAAMSTGVSIRIPEFTRSESWFTKAQDHGFSGNDSEWDYISEDSKLKGKEKAKFLRRDSGLPPSPPIKIHAAVKNAESAIGNIIPDQILSSVQSSLPLNLSATAENAGAQFSTDANTAIPITGSASKTLETRRMSFDSYGDRETTEKRYIEAAGNLEAALKLPRKNWKSFKIPDFRNLVDVNDPIPDLREAIKKTLDVRASSIRDKSLWAKGKRCTERIFTAISPFAKFSLLVAKDGSNVISLIAVQLT